MVKDVVGVWLAIALILALILWFSKWDDLRGA